jgi:hypothetical protein
VTEAGWLASGMPRFEVKHRIRNAVARRSDLFTRKGETVDLTRRGHERSRPKQAPPAPVPPPDSAPALAVAPAPVAASEQPGPERNGTAQPPTFAGGAGRPNRYVRLKQSRLGAERYAALSNGQPPCPKRPGGGAHVWVDQSPDPRKVGRCRHCGEPKAA